MTISTEEFVERLHAGGSERILVRGRTPPREAMDDVATFDTGVAAAFGGDHWQVPLHVTVPTTDGQTGRRFCTARFANAIEGTEQLLTEHAPDSVWLLRHALLIDCLSPVTVGILESRLARVSTAVDATFVTWTGASTPVSDGLYDSVVEP
ncbi:hypothetical protein [Haladaptatus caseinilyticus]|uniref:hypothetical protein n=1 Tax=Haladaptatus caseinilyticus TaxID=2993314 RepID=UPI00224AB009|nr:hypothetical protein [Haladaptatus caseinilyticus]